MLKPAVPSILRAAGVLLLAVFCNGIVSVFVWQVIKGFQSGRPDWFLTIFMIPFVAVGIAMVAAFFYSLLALTNPRCRLSVSPGVFVPGLSVDISWEVHGATHRLERLLIVIEGNDHQPRVSMALRWRVIGSVRWGGS